MRVIDDATKQAFGRRLEQLATDRGLNQSALARQASKHLPAAMSRDSVSKYMRGKNWPGPTHMAALAKALGVSQSELAPEADGSTFELRQTGDKVRLKIDQTVTFDVAAQIAALLTKGKT